MLNKSAEKVLKCIIKKSNGNLEELISISHKDFKDKAITSGLINSICRQLHKEGYISNAYLSCGDDETIDVYLSHNGFSYFDNKKTKNFRFWIPIIITNLISLAALIIAILAYLKPIVEQPHL